MSEIKPEDINDELQEAFSNWGVYPSKQEIAHALNAAQKHGFTVLKHGELHWVECELNGLKEWHAVSSRYDFRIDQSIQYSGEFIADYTNRHDSINTRHYHLLTLEAAKAHCQELEDQARKGNA